MFREHPAQKTHDVLRQTQSLIGSAARLVEQASNLSANTKNDILTDLTTYWDSYEASYWRGTGRLAQWGLPSLVVKQLRSLRVHWQKLVRPYLPHA
jgi:hypothetical protein